MAKSLENRYTLGDKSWTLDFDKLTVDDYIELKKITGYNVARLVVAYDDWDPLALKAVVWMARRKSGEDIAWDDPAMSFVVTELDIEALRDDTAPEAPGTSGEKPGPTKAPRAPRPRTPKTRTSRTK